MAPTLVSAVVQVDSECIALTVVIKRYYVGKFLLSKEAFAIFIKRLNMNIL